MKKVLVLGDSISFSRRHKKQRLEDSWPYLLQEKSGAFVVMRTEGGGTSRSVLRQLEMLSNYYSAPSDPSFSHAVVQVGIVDCCPRALPLPVAQILDRLPGGSMLVSKWLEKLMKNFGIRGRPWISPTAFRQNMQEILSKLELMADRIAVLAIAPAVKFLPTNAPGVVERVRQYNEILCAVVQAHAAFRVGRIYFYDLWHEAVLVAGGKAVEELILEDGHHLTVAGHEWVAAHLIEGFELVGESEAAKVRNGA